MFIEIPDVLDAAQLQRLHEIAAKAKFVDGRLSNPNNLTKKNLQLDLAGSAYKESARIMAEAMWRNETVMNFAFVNRLAPPLMCRYKPDMAYGMHSDNAYVNVGGSMLRSDVSSTIFLAPPDSYEGGELAIHLGERTVDIKLAAGSAVLYPSTTLHEVKPVTAGERFVAITFIESKVRDEQQRHLLYTLNEIAALEGNNISWENRVLLQHVSASLERMWSG